VKVVARRWVRIAAKRPDLVADGAERGAAVQDRGAGGTFIVDEAVGVAVSHPVTPARSAALVVEARLSARSAHYVVVAGSGARF
jgi:hypothetical protein